MSPTDFGGPWTRTKLDILKSYLDRYTMVLKNQSFRLTYVDAFAGSGFWKPRSAGALEDPTDFRAMWKGSAATALDIDNKPFDRLVFIEKDDDRCSSLQKLASRYTGRRIEIVNEDANKAIPALCRTFGAYDRAVVFLDPFATAVSWSTVETLADTVMDLYRERLDSVFEKVAPTPRVLCNSNKTPMFALYFAASNKKGANRAMPIADHLLTKW